MKNMGETWPSNMVRKWRHKLMSFYNMKMSIIWALYISIIIWALKAKFSQFDFGDFKMKATATIVHNMLVLAF